MNMKRQIQDFLRYFISIQDGTNKDIPNHKIEKIYFNPEFYRTFVKAQYIKKDDKFFRGYPFVIDNEEDADYWGMDLNCLDKKKKIKDEISKIKGKCEIIDSEKLEQDDFNLEVGKSYIFK